MSLRFHPLKIGAVEQAAADGSAVALTCLVPVALRAVFAFSAGQHITLRAYVDGVELRRSYSLCSTPEQLRRDGVLRIGVRVVPGGRFSGYVAESLRPGWCLDVLPPVGNFTTAFDPGRRAHYAAIAAGSGITPVLSLAATALAVEPRSSVTVLHGSRTVDSAMFVEELADLKNRYPARLRLVPVFSRERAGSGLSHGRLDHVTLTRYLATALEPGRVAEWFLCGPPGVVQAARRTLAEHGVDSADDSIVHTELFHGDTAPAATARIAPPSPVEPVRSPGQPHELVVVLDGRTSVVRHPGGQRLLDAAMSVRPELPYSCRTGVCVTCRAKVVDGEVRMTGGAALTEQELAAGYVLPCQAVPVTERVTLDFDVS
ncbi:2Fe-2S iron-sulfur cluster-binding protein [Actinokineospora diospyrosa]|uniref:Ring-1,2-phenylacetyl-CoA epoxidase subunit PaaE n=1 Tax=Actinokineospora diospyrosa TaxID=103728 RepID=A0ABT1IEB4_9PSEU|nr:2Fe-2S iron-sulfur cluster-binding protein [Actinokineospora diospyrosa]MCP2270967.1 ring-1,2-phenylacetyl-CoA epoxidase subunit PaaE [Actinokineospora diospyrosa]